MKVSPLRLISSCASLVIIFSFACSSFSGAAESHVVVEANSGKVLLELEAEKVRPVASLTKIATAMVVLDWAKLSGASMAQMARVPESASVLGGSNPMGLIPGDQISLREAMYSMMLGSDNIAAHTLAEHAGASILSRAGGKSAGLSFYRGGQKQSFKVANTHALIGKSGVNGIKSGSTVLAGSCAATSVEKKAIVQKQADGSTKLTGRRLIVIALKSEDRWGVTQTLINQGWAAYEGWRQEGSIVTEARELLRVPIPK